MISEMLKYLRTIDGGCAWESEPDTRGSPSLNFVLCGQYYGFFVPRNGRMRVGPIQRASIANINAADGIAKVVHSVADVAKVLGRGDVRAELYRHTSPAQMRNLLRGWAAKDYRLDWLGDLVHQLPPDQKALVCLRFVDRMPVDAIATQMAYTDRRVNQMLRAATDKLIEWSNNRK